MAENVFDTAKIFVKGGDGGTVVSVSDEKNMYLEADLMAVTAGAAVTWFLLMKAFIP